MPDEPMDRPRALELLNEALAHQVASPARFAFLAGSTEGFDVQFVASELWSFGQRELDDMRRLVEKIVALGGSPRATLSVQLEPGPLAELVDDVIAAEREAVEALRNVIPSTGVEGEGEALEHLLEHMIMRKHEQIDFLLRARGKAGR